MRIVVKVDVFPEQALEIILNDLEASSRSDRHEFFTRTLKSKHLLKKYLHDKLGDYIWGIFSREEREWIPDRSPIDGAAISDSTEEYWSHKLLHKLTLLMS